MNWWKFWMLICMWNSIFYLYLKNLDLKSRGLFINFLQGFIDSRCAKSPDFVPVTIDKQVIEKKCFKSRWIIVMRKKSGDFAQRGLNFIIYLNHRF